MLSEKILFILHVPRKVRKKDLIDLAADNNDVNNTLDEIVNEELMYQLILKMHHHYQIYLLYLTKKMIRKKIILN